jgi:hypothetical protein
VVRLHGTLDGWLPAGTTKRSHQCSTVRVGACLHDIYQLRGPACIMALLVLVCHRGVWTDWGSSCVCFIRVFRVHIDGLCGGIS